MDGKTNAPVGEPRHEHNYAEYKNDQLLQAQLAIDHGQLLKKHAPHRIAAAAKAVATYQPALRMTPRMRTIMRSNGCSTNGLSIRRTISARNRPATPRSTCKWR